MQKSKSTLLMILLIAVTVNTALYFIWLLAGYEKAAEYRNFVIWQPIILLLMLSELLVRFISVRNGRSSVGTLKYISAIRPPTRYTISGLFLLLLIIFNLAVLLFQPKAYAPLMMNSFILLILIYSLGSDLNNGIYEKGVLHWGILCRWETIIGYRIKERKHDTLLILEKSRKNGKLDFDYEIKIVLKTEEKSDMLGFVKDKLDVFKSPDGPPGRA